MKFRELIANNRRKEFIGFEYWGKPLPGFGDPNARLVIVGLAPAAHGGNRTGRMFTGDASARFLMKHLHRAGFANQPTSESRDDGLELYDCYITAVVRCVPPDNKPTMTEIRNCSSFFSRELLLLKNAKAILVLGKIAYDSIVRYAKESYSIKKSLKFEHGMRFSLSENFPVVFCSYHPSPRNTNTGKMTDEMFSGVLNEVNSFLAP